MVKPHTADATQVVAGRILPAGTLVYLFCTHWHDSPFPTPAYLAELERRHESGRLSDKDYQKKLAEARDGRERRSRSRSRAARRTGALHRSPPRRFSGP